MGLVITIDGPAASGKSSVSRELAKRLGWSWVSTGAFYRGLGYVAMRKKIDLKDVKALTELIQSDEWSVRMSEENTLVFFGQEDVTQYIFSEEVGQVASLISHYPEVRQCLLDSQRACAQGVIGLIAEGRDCGTVVFPHAEAKVYLTASSEIKAARRAKESGQDEKQIIEAQRIRDAQDSNRKVAPLQIPENALVVDTGNLSFEQVVEKVETFVREQLS